MPEQSWALFKVAEDIDALRARVDDLERRVNAALDASKRNLESDAVPQGEKTSDGSDRLRGAQHDRTKNED